MTVIAANLGLMFRDRPLPDAIRAAAAAGFDAVEFQFPYDDPPEALARALEDAAIPALGINTPRAAPGPGAAGFADDNGYVLKGGDYEDVEFGVIVHPDAPTVELSTLSAARREDFLAQRVVDDAML